MKKFKTLKENEIEHILSAIKLCGGNKSKAAKLLAISEKTIYNKLNKLLGDDNGTKTEIKPQRS